MENTTQIEDVVGFFERADRDYISGWITSQASPTYKFHIIVELNDVAIWEGIADEYREDLEKAGYGAGFCAFNVPTKHLKFEKATNYALRIRVKETDQFLPGGEKNFDADEIYLARPLPTKPISIKETLEIAESPVLHTSFNQLVNGFVERIDRSYISGWAVAEDATSEKLHLTIEADNRAVWHGVADQFRDDLREANLGGGFCSFKVETEQLALSDEREYNIQVKVDITGQILPSHSDNLLPKSPTASMSVSMVGPLNDITGNLDEVSAMGIRGWSFNRSRPDVPVSLDILIDGIFVTRTDARHHRLDLEQAGLGAGRCAFHAALPVQLLDGMPHTVRVVVSNSVLDLNSSPLVFELREPIPIHNLNDIQDRLVSISEEINTIWKRVGVSAQSLMQITAQHSNYELWRESYCNPSEIRKRIHLDELSASKSRPKISVVMPTYNSNAAMLRSAIESVRRQIYPNWELCIVDDASTKVDLQDILNSYAKADPRIKVCLRTQNGHIAVATNDAISMCTGEYVGFLDHDDELSSEALAYVVEAINSGGASVLYSDEDKIDVRGNRLDPHFKPAFNYTLLLSYNYICHFTVIRKSIIDTVGGMRTETNGSQDHDLLLRVVEIIDPSEIVHIPHILYHWRVHEASTSLNTSIKGYAIDSGILAVSSHLERTFVKGAVVSFDEGSYRIKWPLPVNNPKISILIPTRDCAAILATCLNGLFNHTLYQHFEIIIIDNGSVENETKMLFEEARRDMRVKVVEYNKQFNYSAICNFGANEASGDLLLMLNNDIEALSTCEDWLGELLGQINRIGVGAVGTKLLYPNRQVQHAGVICGLGGVAGHSHKYFPSDNPGYFRRISVAQELTACTAACLLIRREVFESVGGFDELNLPVSFNDVDLCLRIRSAGWAVVYTPYAELIHHESYSRGPEDSPAKILRAQKEIGYMRKRWAKWLDNDPAYSPSLTLDREDFGMDLHRGAAQELVARRVSPLG